MSPEELERRMEEQSILVDRAQHASEQVYRQVLDTGLEGISVVEIQDGAQTVGATIVVNGTSTRNLVDCVLHLQQWLVRAGIGEFEGFDFVGKERH